MDYLTLPNSAKLQNAKKRGHCPKNIPTKGPILA